MLKWLWVRTAGKNHRAVRAPFKKKTKNEVKKTKNLKILLSGICCGAGFSQCTFGHSQIRLQTSGHECLLAQIPENWITFGKSLEIESKKTVFVIEKRGLFFTPSTVRTFFWASPQTPKWWSKVAPKNTQRDAKSHVLSAFPVKRVTNIGSHDGMVRWGLPSTIAHEHQKSHSSTVR